MVDHYEVLQVHPSAEPEVIRAAFRALARKHHPDFGGDPRRMMALNEAWNVLGNNVRRAVYDEGRLGRGAGPSERTPARPGREPRQARPSGPLAAAAERRTAAREARARAADPDRPPADRRDGTALDFGRYAGWSVKALADHDPDYLMWLVRTPIGRPLRREIDERLGARAEVAGSNGSGGTVTAVKARPSLFRLRTR